MAIFLNDSIRTQVAKPVEDKRMNNGVPYTSVAEANSLLNSITGRYESLEVIIGTPSNWSVYWYKDGIGDEDLILKEEDLADVATSGNHSDLNLDDGTNPHNTTKSDVGLSNVPNLDTTDAVNNEHVQNTDTILDEGGSNEITVEEIKTHVESTDNPHEIDLQKAYDETALNEDALEKVIGINSGGNVVEQEPISQTLLNQYNQSSTTGDTLANLLQPDFGAAVFTSSDMQEGNSYSGEIYLEIDNNSTATAKQIELFGIELFNAASAIPEIKGRLAFDIDFYNQAGNNISYRVSYGFVSPGLQFYGSEESTIDNTANRDIELTVNGDASDNIYVNKAKIKRENLKGIL